MGQREAIWIKIYPETPLLLGDQSGIGTFQETSDHIPGTAIRGAVAGRFLEQCTQPDYLKHHALCPDKEICPFWQLFGQDEPHFAPAYPGGLAPTYPIPLTARSCKHFPGFVSGEQDKKHHGVIDSLLGEFAYGVISDVTYPARPQLQPELDLEWSLDTAWHPDRYKPYAVCPICEQAGVKEQRLKPIAGYYHYDQQGRFYPVDQPPQAARTHVGINRARAVAEDRLLFTQKSLQSEGQPPFVSQVSIVPHQAEAMKKALSQRYEVGRGRSRGYGQVEFKVTTTPVYPPVRKRLELFQEAAGVVLYPYQQIDKRVQTVIPGHLFSLTLRSPAILHRFGQPVRVPQATDLGLPSEVISLQAWARMETIGGWDSAAQLPRRTQMAVRAGSAFLYYAPASLPYEILISHLERLEEVGIGEERERGFGEIGVCEQFHQALVRHQPGGQK